MDNIDQVNMDNQLPEPSIQPVLPQVEMDNDFNEQGGCQPTDKAVKRKAVDRFYRQAGCIEIFQWKASRLQALQKYKVTHIATRFYPFKPIGRIASLL